MNDIERIKEEIGTAIGEASMCWSETPKGVFDSDKAIKIISKLFDEFLIMHQRLLLGYESTREEKLDKCKQALEFYYEQSNHQVANNCLKEVWGSDEL